MYTGGNRFIMKCPLPVHLFPIKAAHTYRRIFCSFAVSNDTVIIPFTRERMQEKTFPVLLLQFFLRTDFPVKSRAASEADKSAPYVFFQIVKGQPVTGY